MIHIIANPAAQSGAGRKTTRKLLRACIKNDLATSLHMTTHPGHAGEMAANLHLSHDDTLIIIGGDGSVNEVINGFPCSPMCPVLLLPSGSGNDFARGLRMSKRVEDVIAILKDRDYRLSTELLDLGEASIYIPGRTTEEDPIQKRFAVSCGLGMDAAVCLHINKSPLKKIFNQLHMGKLTYLIIGIWELLRTSRNRRATVHLTMDYDNCELFDHVAFVSVHNTAYEGGGFPFAPSADPQDGLLSVCVVTVKHRLQLVPVLLASLKNGSHVKFKNHVHTFQCRQLEIKADRPMAFHSDGEPMPGINHIEVEALPDFLPFLYRRKAAKKG